MKGTRHMMFMVFMAATLLPVVLFAYSVNLPQTGRITSIYSGDDGDLRAGIAWPAPRFTIIYCHETGPCADQSSDCDDIAATDMIRDNLTGLVWARSGRLDGGDYVLWSEALDFANNLELGGFSDWRLPNILEFESLLNYDCGFLESGHWEWLESQGFVNVGFDPQRSRYQRFWLSTGYQDPTTAVQLRYHFYVHKSGYFDTFPLPLPDSGDPYPWKSYTLPVRAGQLDFPDSLYPANLWKTGQTMSFSPGDDGDLQMGVAAPSPRFVDNGDGTVLDLLTKLMWFQNQFCSKTIGYNPSGFSLDSFNGQMKWEEALDYIDMINNETIDVSPCTTSSYTDWRLPNPKELLSLMDFDQDCSDPITDSLPDGHCFALMADS